MSPRLLSRFCALVALSAVAACASNGSVVPQQQQSLLSAPQQQSPLDASAAEAPLSAIPLAATPKSGVPDPCKIPGIWYFRGPCMEFGMQSSGLGLGLGYIGGYDLSMQFSKNNAKSGDNFIVGDGTSDRTITGTVQGHKFPLYGSVPCVTMQGPTKCAGKGLIYAEIINVSRNAVKFNAIPTIKLNDKRKFRGLNDCQVDGLGVFGGKLSWLELPIKASPNNGELDFPTVNLKITMPAETAVFFAIDCK